MPGSGHLEGTKTAHMMKIYVLSLAVEPNIALEYLGLVAEVVDVDSSLSLQ